MEDLQRTILCVDDDPDDRFLLAETINLMQPELNIVEAENGQKALEYLNNRKSDEEQLPCLIILDINMPLLDGKETLTRIKEDPQLRKVPVVMFTSSENPHDKALFQSKGVDFFTKPFHLSAMPGVVQRLLAYCC